ncbi:hypothetical protein [Streptomyces sp. PsTaAH-124]|uniref:hypothetical protein n=1 Tax=Streptomyces sp. PsTaAH-124 TaxID=1157638 RepID=UPI00037A4AA6|nr:hypothetical protein [Streptomyces sp. PsTaAH-124]
MAAKLGALVWEIAYDQWIDTGTDTGADTDTDTGTGTGEDFGPLARRALTAVRVTAAAAQ